MRNPPQQGGDSHHPDTVDDVLRAAALSYDSDADAAPRLVAKGRGLIAERLLEIAGEHGLAVRQDPTLVGMLDAIDLGNEIPVELYGVIAEVLAWAYSADQRAGEQSRQRRGPGQQAA